MMVSGSLDVTRTLYFSVAKVSELFYIEKLKEIKNLDLHIHVTREDDHEYEKDRVDIHSIEAIPETEFYICGSPKMVSDVKEKLKAQ
jgi:NAD(P)H-flavin reductase